MLSTVVLFIGVLLTRTLLIPLDILRGLHVPIWLMAVGVVALLTWCLGD
ncbi:hypothetical protein [Myxacorys almedinensis]|uniref:Uncharacterized protein n=1 Tax=Myxacorys almedinensis A TaxID=2690445 RepID=A0A8J7ZC95_9CYAN|nr:hypothetical protein [Myxacorys almedinensis]NDJ19305.1 hypothetical protein [Myxacorys almedinensis A]